jgi:hypothetical protein
MTTLWQYFGNFDDREFFRIVVIAGFLFGIPLAIGLLAKLVAWSARCVAQCRDILIREVEDQCEKKSPGEVFIAASPQPAGDR